jgi:hypothetical protein
LLLGEVFAQVHAGFGFFGAERLGGELALFADQHFDARLGGFQLRAAAIAEPHAALEQRQRALQRKVAAFQFLDHLFQLVERGFE